MSVYNYRRFDKLLKLCEIFNQYFCNVAKDIGPDDTTTENDTISSIMRTFESHTSVKLSKENCPQTNEFNFCKIEEKDVKSFLSKMNPKKAVGFDRIPSKLLKIASSELSGPLNYLINCSINASIYLEIC